MERKGYQHGGSSYNTGIFFTIAFLLLSFLGSPAFAIDLCPVVTQLFYGKDFGKAIATVGVIGVGVSAAFGGVRPGPAVVIVIGIYGIFNAGSLAAQAGASGGCSVS